MPDYLISVDVSRSFAFYYNPNFKLIEDGWTLYQVTTKTAFMRTA